MRPRRAARHADPADFLTFFNFLSFFDGNFAHVDIAGDNILAVADQNGFAR